MEDGWILARSIEYAFSTAATAKEVGIEKALGIFDAIRSPYYTRM